MEDDSRVVEGFVFSTSTEAMSALQEQKNIDIIRQRTPLSDSKAAYALYCKLIERNMFKTMVGYAFLYELRHKLISEFGYAPEQLPMVTLPQSTHTDVIGDAKQDMMKKQMEQLKLAKTRLTIVILALIAMVAGMFVIAMINPNIGYVNTEQKVLNKYSTWEEDLRNREEAIKQREKELNIENPE